jgi:predicted ATP-grasp superfamily ATP-dependent carboligase
VAPYVLILGASVRAAAISAIRAGHAPNCADFFGDQDLVLTCPARHIDHRHSTDQFVDVAESYRPSAWFYTGGFENHAELVDRISKTHRLWGIEGETLRAIRDPLRVARVLEKARIPAPAVALTPQALPGDGSWLSKPLNSGGGRGIEPLIAGHRSEPDKRYFQQRVNGPSFSALYIGTPPVARLIGVTRQLTGAPGNPFGYRGNIGPLLTAAPLTARLEALGCALTATFRLTGWFGVDYILNRGIPWPVEINPRYTASVEIHELALRRSLLVDHKRACEGIVDRSSGSASSLEPPQSVLGKLIVYASHRLVVPECLRLRDGPGDLYSMKTIADVPWPGTTIDAGHPVMTLLAKASTLESCRKRLFRLEQKWLGQLGLTCDQPARRRS